MTIATINALAELSATSVATYGGFDNAAKGDAGKAVLIANLQGGGFTKDQAEAFADRYGTQGLGLALQHRGLGH